MNLIKRRYFEEYNLQLILYILTFWIKVFSPNSKTWDKFVLFLKILAIYTIRVAVSGNFQFDSKRFYRYSIYAFWKRSRIHGILIHSKVELTDNFLLHLKCHLSLIFLLWQSNLKHFLEFLRKMILRSRLRCKLLMKKWCDLEVIFLCLWL